MEQQESIRRHVNSLIHDLQRRAVSPPPVILHRFTPHFPRTRKQPFRVTCWCGEDAFSAYQFETHDLERMFAWMRKHENCAPPEVS